MESLTELCRQLNEHPVLESIRIDNNVTYASRLKEEELEYSASIVQRRTTENEAATSHGR